MSSDGEHFNFEQIAIQEEGDSRPSLDELAISLDDRPPNPFLPVEENVYSQFEVIMRDTKISNLRGDAREKVKKLLNIQKENRRDWRGVAARMDVEPSTIEKIEKDYIEDPTEKLFQVISDKKAKQLLWVLVEMKRHDVVNIFREEMHDNKSESLQSRRWVEVSKAHKEMFKNLVEDEKKLSAQIMEVNSVRVCLDEKFLIGAGGQSSGVYVGLGTDGSEKAVKLFLKATHGRVAEQERQLLKKCETKNLTHVVKYWSFQDTTPFAFLIMELCEETLAKFVSDNSRDHLVKLAPDIIQQILKGLADLHRKPDRILHRDLKPSNILRNVHDEWLLADFGIGRILSDDDTTHLSKERGTRKWMAIESCSKSGTSDDGNVRYKTESDIQVAGMVAFYILTKGGHPFGEDEQQIRNNLLAANPVNLNMLDDHPLAKDLISWMLSHDPKDRPSAEEALQHPYLKSKEQQFSLLCGMGNEPHVKKNDVNSDVVKELSEDKTDWRARIDYGVLEYLSYDQVQKKQYRYNSSWTQCLRLIRNVKEHWKDCERTEPEAEKVGDPQEFFLKLFPDLILVVFKIARSRDDLKELSGLKEYFNQ